MAVRKAAAPKRRRRRTTAAKKTTTATRKPTRRKRRTTAKTTGTRRRRGRPATKRTARKTTAKRRPARRKTARRKTATGATRKRRTTRGRPAKRTAVKKKPSKSKTAKKTSIARSKVSGKPRAVKKSAERISEGVKQVRKRPEKKQLLSDSRAHSVLKQQTSIEVKMAEAKKTNAPTEKQVSSKEEVSPYKETPGESYMNAKQQDHFRNLLQQRKLALLDDMDRTVHYLQDEGAALPDMSDRATQEEEFNLELRARDRERKLIRKIEDALQQLKEGNYGYCHSCGIEIGIRRLEARPTADLCFDCKSVAEIREKQTGG